MKTWLLVLIISLSLLLLTVAMSFAVYFLAKERKLTPKKKWWIVSLTALAAMFVCSIVFTAVFVPPAVERNYPPVIRPDIVVSETETVTKDETKKVTERVTKELAESDPELTQEEIDAIVAEAVAAEVPGLVAVRADEIEKNIRGELFLVSVDSLLLIENNAAKVSTIKLAIIDKKLTP